MSAALARVLPRLLEWDEDTWDEHWGLVAEVVTTHPERDLLAATSAWCASSDPGVQAVGLDVLGELAAIVPDARELLLAVAESLHRSSDPDVRWAVAVALGSGSDRSAGADQPVTTMLVRLIQDPDRDVRVQATYALTLPFDNEPQDGPVVVALLGALNDSDAHIRDWAAFAVGVLRDVDSDVVRDSLWRLLDDPEADTAGEAAVGLARRKDARLLEPLSDRLGDPQVGNLWVEAAAELGDPRLLPRLEHLKSTRWQDDDPRPDVLDRALQACSHPLRHERNDRAKPGRGASDSSS